jgi:hypothetical protein
VRASAGTALREAPALTMHVSVLILRRRRTEAADLAESPGQPLQKARGCGWARMGQGAAPLNNRPIRAAGRWDHARGGPGRARWRLVLGHARRKADARKTPDTTRPKRSLQRWNGTFGEAGSGGAVRGYRGTVCYTVGMQRGPGTWQEMGLGRSRAEKADQKRDVAKTRAQHARQGGTLATPAIRRLRHG